MALYRRRWVGCCGEIGKWNFQQTLQLIVLILKKKNLPGVIQEGFHYGGEYLPDLLCPHCPYKLCESDFLEKFFPNLVSR